MRIRRRAVPPPLTRPGFASSIPDQAAWDALCADTAAMPGYQTVKVVLDRRQRDAPVLHYPDTVRYPSHVDFCRTLDPRVDAGFDTTMYQSPERPFVLSTLTRWVADDDAEPRFWLELWPGDNLAAEAILDLLDLVRGTCFFGSSLRFKAASDDQRRRVTSGATAAQLDRLGPLLDPGEIQRGAAYQGLTLGTAYGRLRILRDGPDLDTRLADLTPYDVVVTESLPLQIGPVSGLITSEHQTPLAHVAVLSENRGSPNCALVGAHRRPELVALEGGWVRLSVRRDAHELGPADEALARAEVEKRLAVLRAGAPPLEVDARHSELVDLGRRRSRRVGVVGAKSAALARLYAVRALGEHAVPGFTVPIGAYLRTLEQQPSLTRLIEEVLATEAGRTGTGTSVNAALASLRAAILTAPIDPRLVEAVGDRIRSWAAGDVVFRSSSNCEDLPGFNGAGLADSVRLSGSLTHDLVADRIREVWASLWTDRGFAERSAFGIDQGRVAMAVLIQPVVSHHAHVVAITTNTVKPALLPAYFLNLLPSGGLVTDAGTASAEQLLLFDDEPACAEVICRAEGQPRSLLPDELLAPTRDMLKVVDRRVRREAGGRCAAADVEFLVRDAGTGSSRLALLQARPYGVA